MEGRKAPFHISLMITFAVANSLITAPFYKKSLLPLALACVFSVLIIFIFTAFQNAFTAKLKSGAIKKAAAIAAAAGALAVLAISFYEFTDFIYGAVLVRSNITAIKAVFAVCVYCLSVSSRGAVFKFSFLSALVSAAVLIILFCLSAKTFDIKHLSGIFDFSHLSLRQTGVYTAVLCLPGLAAVAFIGKGGNKSSPTVLCGGALAGAALYFLAVFDSVLSFGLPLAARLDYPYISDISTVTVGSLFTRMDGFAYIAFFTCYLTKCAVCTRLFAELVFGERYKKPVSAVICALLALI